MERKLRVAVEGCGHGTLNAIYASIAKSCEIKGWHGIDLLIIGGDFQAVRNSYDLNCMSVPVKYREIGDFHEYYSGARKAPYLTIFVGGNHEASNHLWELYYGGWVAPNIYYLGAANVVRLGPLRIAGLSGIWKGYNFNKLHHERIPYNQDDVKSVYHVRELDVRKLMQIQTQVDVGISHDWPKGVEWMGNWKALFARKNGFEADARDGSLGSSAAKYLMDRLRPPHWFSAHLHCKFAAIVDYGPKVALGPPTESIFNGTNNAGSTEKTNTEEIHVDLEDDLPVQAAHSHPLVIRNTDEIDLEMDDDVSQDLPPITALAANRTTSEPAATEVQVVSEDLRAQLPRSFTRPQSTASTNTLPFPEAITNKVTRFLALDKCLPNRQFLQILDIEPISLTTTSATSSSAPTSPHRLCYDKEWLAITRAFATHPIIGDRSTPTLPNKGEAFYRPLIETEELWVEENLERTEKMMIPENFQFTAPVYDASIGIGVREQPREYTNPQTVAFCEMLGIENVFCASEAEREERWRRGPRAEEPRMGRGGRGRGGWGGRGGGRGMGRGRGRGGGLR